jgi:hypothetical protein
VALLLQVCVNLDDFFDDIVVVRVPSVAIRYRLPEDVLRRVKHFASSTMCFREIAYKTPCAEFVVLVAANVSA